MGSEPLGMQERENQITQKAEGNERSQRIIKDHNSFSSPPFAGIGVGDRKCEQAERVRDHLRTSIMESSLMRLIAIIVWHGLGEAVASDQRRNNH
jgi:hypothetical protein